MFSSSAPTRSNPRASRFSLLTQNQEVYIPQTYNHFTINGKAKEFRLLMRKPPSFAFSCLFYAAGVSGLGSMWVADLFYGGKGLKLFNCFGGYRKKQYFRNRLRKHRGVAQLVQSAAVTLQRSPVRARASLPQATKEECRKRGVPLFFKGYGGRCRRQRKV